jgi:hypothetical protein
MKIKHTFVFTLVLGLVWTGYLFGYVFGPDPAVNGILGSGQTCAMSGCHSQFPVNVSGGSVTIGGLPGSGWVAGQTYPLTVTVQRTGQRVFGFQLSAVADVTGQQAGTLAGSNQAVKLVCGQGSRQVGCNTAGAVQFAEHSNATAQGTFQVNWTAPSSADAGVVRFNVAGNAANGDLNNQGDFIYTRVETLGPAAVDPGPGPGPGPTSAFYFPQVADGIQADGISWKTTIFLANPPGGSTASGAITFTTSAGAPFNISFVDDAGSSVSSGNTIPFSIPPGQSRKFVSTSAGSLSVGYAIVSASADVKGTAVFSEFAPNGVLIGEAGVPSAAVLARQAIFVDTQASFSTGVAYVNPNPLPASIALQLVAGDGTPIGAPVNATLLPNQHTAAFVNQLFASAPAFAGTMQITSDARVAAIALRFAPSGSFTTLPPVPLN